MMKTAIVLSSSTMGLGVIRALGRMGVPIVTVSYDDNDMGHSSKYVSGNIKVPHPEKFEDQFVKVLVETSQRFERGILIPASDATLAVVARHKKELEVHYIVACTETDITEQYINKKLTYRLAKSIGVPVPKTVFPQTINELENYGNTLGYPCLLKPSQSHLFTAHFKQKMFRVENIDQLRTIYKKSIDANLGVMLQEIIPGGAENGVNYNSYFFDGRPLVEFTAEKVRNGPSMFGSPRVAISKEIPDVIAPGRKILQAMGFYGFSCTEFKLDERDGVYKLMEVNGRHNLSSLLAVKCGINFPWLHYNHLVNGEIPEKSNFKSGIYWIDIPRDIGYSLKSYKEENYSLLQYLRPYFGPNTFAILSIYDLGPTINKIYSMFKQAFYNLFSKNK